MGDEADRDFDNWLMGLDDNEDWWDEEQEKQEKALLEKLPEDFQIDWED